MGSREIMRAKDHVLLRSKEATAKSQMKAGVVYDDDTVEDHTAERSLADGLTGTLDHPVLSYCLHPLRFLNLTDTERAGVLATFVGASKAVIRLALKEEIGEIKVEAVKKAIKEAGLAPLDLEGNRKAAIKFRQELKAERKLLMKEPPVISEYDLPDDYKAKVAVEKKTLEEFNRRMAIWMEKAKVVGEYETSKKNLADQVKKVSAKIAEFKKQIVKVPPLPEYHPAEYDMLSIAIGMIDAKDKDQGYSCPTCRGNVTESRLTSMRKRMKELEGFHEKWLESTEAQSKNDRLSGQIETLMKDLKSLMEQDKAIVQPEGADAEKPSDAEKEGAVAIEVRMGKYEEFLREENKFQSDYDRDIELDEWIGECDRIDDALADGGPVQERIAKSGKRLQLDEKLISAWGIEDLEIKDNGQISAKGVECRLLSDSEKYRVAGAIGLALAQISGLGVVWMDGFELLLPHVQNAFLKAVGGKAKGMNNIFLSYASMKVPQNVPDWIQIHQA